MFCELYSFLLINRKLIKKFPFVVGIVALIVKMITSYPLILICGRGAFDGLYAEILQVSNDEFVLLEKPRRIIVTTIWFVSTVTLAVTLSDIGVVIELLGCLACVNVFVFPGKLISEVETGTAR